jgi:hypothetical protein
MLLTDEKQSFAAAPADAATTLRAFIIKKKSHKSSRVVMVPLALCPYILLSA